MKNVSRNLIVLFSIFYFFISGDRTFSQSSHIRVAIYDDAGGSGAGPDNIELCLFDTSLYTTTRVTAAQIRDGILNNFDVIVQPGGSGSEQAATLEPSGRDSIRQFVHRGGGYLGICAGAYLVSSDYSWSLNILNTKVIDKAHWNRGNAPLVIRFNSKGKKFYDLSNDTVTIGYFQGPVMAPAGIDSLPGYIELSVFQTEIALNGAVPGLMIGKTAFAQSCYGFGRVFAMSPHPEKQAELRYMVSRAIDWLAGDDNFAAFSSPMENEKCVIGTSKKIKWVSDGGVDTMHIDYSTDNGGTWNLITAAATSPYSWIVPNTPSLSCKMRVLSNNRSGIGDTIAFIIEIPKPAITSAANGNWSSEGTWIGGVVPTSNDDVVIGVGHTVTVDAESNCKNLSFGDATSRLGLNANLNIYGDFNLFNPSVNPFYSTSSLWITGAKIVFTGDAEVQTITNLGTTSTSPFPLRFNELVIDKNSGKVTTGSSNYKLGIGTSLEVISGIFELGSTDDIEGRDVSGTATTPTITVQADGTFDMKGSTSHIRRGNFTPEESSKIGLMAVYGTANLAGSSTNRINFTNVDIENGGLVNITYYSTGGNMGTGCFNPGTITIKSGGKLKNNLNTALWYGNLTVPPSITINSGGEYEVSGSASTLPQGGITQNNGSVIRFSSGSATITLPAGISNYKTLILSNSGLKSLGTTTNIEEYLQLSGTATLGLGGFLLTYSSSATLRYGTSGQSSAQTTTNNEWPASGGPNNVQIYSGSGVTLHDNRTINGTLTLTLGQFDNNGSANDKVLSMGNGATISRARGTLSSVPSFVSSVNLRYTSSIEHITTGFEMPASGSVLNDLTIQSTQGITLGADVTVNGTLALTNSSITLGSYNLTLAGSTAISGIPSVSNMIIADGSGELRKEITGVGSFTFPVGDNTGIAEYSPVTLNFTNGSFGSGAYAGVKLTNSSHPNFLGTPADYITRYWTVNQSGISSFSCDVKFNYVDADVVGATESNIVLWKYDGGWSNPLLPSTDITLNEMTGTVSSFSDFTGSDNGALPIELSAFKVTSNRNVVNLRWTTVSEINSGLFEVQRSSENQDWIKIGEVAAAGNSNSPKEYSYTDKNLSSLKYQYRLKMIDADGSYKYSSVVEAEIQLPKEYSISQNYPNPFNPTTRIDYQLPFDSKVTIELYGITGEKIATLINSDLSAGYYTADVNASELNLASGAYIYRMSANSQLGQSFVQVKKFVLTK